MSSGFITESEALEERRRRQEEWEKVRTEDQPKEAPEEPYDNRPLFTRLEEQRLKKEAEYEEAHKLKNMIRGLDDDEVGFLDLVESSKAQAAQQIFLEEKKEMQEFRERVSNATESAEMQRLRAQLAPSRPAPPAPMRNSLQGVIVRKRKASEVDAEKTDKDAPAAKQNGVANNTTSGAAGALRVVGVLPGLGHYGACSSDSDCSSDEDDCCTKRDLLGRRAADKKKEEDKS
ncbi:PSME3-interacting protein [Plutella xylostella]|uniref:PSME3-interacting protein n=1 Tax=Plutella xylostella TaxID=51655 RepID=UPI00203250B8|nr:PSME3-interacting protein [Plutella xylostella]